MKKQILGLVATTLLLTSCNNQNSISDDKNNSTDVYTKVFTVDNLKTQTFTIDNSVDNILTGETGTKIRINRNSFVDKSGNLVKGKVEIELKEVLTQADMVLGNLTTVFNGKPLETGGMVFLNAKSNESNLLIAPDKLIYISLPTDSVLPNMSVFQGKQDSLGVKWSDPVALFQEAESDTARPMWSFEKTTNLKYSVDGFQNPSDAPQEVQSEVGRIAWTGDGLKITKDSTFEIGKFTVRFYKQNKLQKWSETFTNEKGSNSFIEDRKTNYIFSIKKLGWANIDRLMMDPRTKDVELITAVDNHSEFNIVYVTMITQQMYLPGYQKKDETYSFSHGDEENQQLPVGETATILATAYKNDRPFFALKKIVISDKQKITFKLEETTMDKLKTILKDKI